MLPLAGAQVSWVALQPGRKGGDDLGGLAPQLFIDGWREEQRIGVLGDIGCRAIQRHGAPLRPRHSGDQLQEGWLAESVSAHQDDDLAATEA